MESREPIIRPRSKNDVVLRIILTVAGDNITLDYEGWNTYPLERGQIEPLFTEVGLELLDGSYTFDVRHNGVLVQTPESFDEAQSRVLVEGKLGKQFKANLDKLIAAYTSMPGDDQLEEIVRAAVQKAILVFDEDPLKEQLRVPTFVQLEAATFEGGCASCAFCEEGTSFMAKLMREKPPLRSDVVTVAGVNIRAIEEDGEIAIVIGYLDHESIFEKPFHNDLARRLQPLLTPELIRSVIQESLVMAEVARRVIERSSIQTMDAYGLSMIEIDALADEREAQIREEARRRREAPQGNGIDDLLGQLFSGQGGGIQVMRLGPDGLEEFDPESLR